MRAQGTDMFVADLNLAPVPNGAVQLKCEADDTGTPPVTGSDTVDTFLDLGPNILILEPADKSTHALITPVLIKFQVTPAPLDDSDKEAAPVDVHLDVSGQSVAFTEDPAQKGLYSASVDFNDKTVFAMAPSSAEITVTAASSRTPDAPTRVVKSDITLDADGPTITINAPKNNDIVGGNKSLVATIKDPSGIKQGSVSATIAPELFPPLTDWVVKGDTYTATFDTRAYPLALTSLTINITAEDNVGNVSKAPLVLHLDNLPPLISMDPPLYREWKKGGTTGHVCSAAFDPVGADAMNDLGTSRASALYRAMVWDETNESQDANVSFLAGIKPGSVEMYVQLDRSVPLLIDTNGDGVCDEINKRSSSTAAPTPGAPLLLALAPLSVRGTAWYPAAPADADWGNSASTVDPGFCSAGTATMPPDPLCSSTAMPRAISAPPEGNPPAIYANSPTNNAMLGCEGLTHELLPTVQEGWTCIAVRAEDAIDNVGISPPIRVCFDDGVDPPAPCDPALDTPPTCADNCAWPPDFRKNMLYPAK